MRAGALGDVLLLRPAVAALRRAGARVLLMAPEHSGRALVGPGGSEVDGLIPWDRADVAPLMADGGVPTRSLRRALGALDLVIAYTRSTALARNLAQLAPSVIPCDPAPPPGGGSHAARCFAEPLAGLGLDVDTEPPACQPTGAEREAATALEARLPRRFLALHPGSGSAHKNWPASSFAALAERRASDQPWLLVEGPADTAAADVLRRQPNAVTATALPARVLGTLLSRSGLFVGNDSGVSHLAAAFGAPAVALFGPTDPALWRPLGARVCALRSPTGHMGDLGLEEVEAACRAVTSAAAGPPGC